METIFDEIRKDISPDLIPDHDKFVKVNIRNKEEDRVYENGVCKLCYYCFCIEYKNGHLTSLLQLLILMLRYQNQWMATRCYIHVLIKLAVRPKKGTTLTWWCIILQFHYWHFYWNVVNIPISYMVVMSIIEIWIYKRFDFHMVTTVSHWWGLLQKNSIEDFRMGPYLSLFIHGIEEVDKTCSDELKSMCEIHWPENVAKDKNCPHFGYIRHRRYVQLTNQIFTRFCKFFGLGCV